MAAIKMISAMVQEAYNTKSEQSEKLSKGGKDGDTYETDSILSLHVKDSSGIFSYTVRSNDGKGNSTEYTFDCLCIGGRLCYACKYLPLVSFDGYIQRHKGKGENQERSKARHEQVIRIYLGKLFLHLQIEAVEQNT